MSEPVVTIQHMRALGYCARSGRKWFADHGAQIGYTWQDFLDKRVPAGAVESVGENFGLRVAEQARKANPDGR